MTGKRKLAIRKSAFDWRNNRLPHMHRPDCQTACVRQNRMDAGVPCLACRVRLTVRNTPHGELRLTRREGQRNAARMAFLQDPLGIPAYPWIVHTIEIHSHFKSACPRPRVTDESTYNTDFLEIVLRMKTRTRLARIRAQSATTCTHSRRELLQGFGTRQCCSERDGADTHKKYLYRSESPRRESDTCHRAAEPKHERERQDFSTGASAASAKPTSKQQLPLTPTTVINGACSRQFSLTSKPLGTDARTKFEMLTQMPNHHRIDNILTNASAILSAWA